MHLNLILSLLQDEDIEAVEVHLTTKEAIKVKEISDKSTDDVLIVKEPENTLISLKNIALVKGIKKRDRDVSHIFN